MEIYCDKELFVEIMRKYSEKDVFTLITENDLAVKPEELRSDKTVDSKEVVSHQ